MTERQHDGGARRHRIHVSGPAVPGAGGNGAADGAGRGETAASAADPAAQLEAVRAELEAARQEAGELRAAWQRSAADFQNYRRRSEQEREATLGLASEALIRKLLGVVDDFDRALEAMPAEAGGSGWVEGVWLVERKLRALLESEGVSPIESVGKPFDPREHEAVVHQETSDAPDGTVIAELQRGYRLRDRVLRPALVAVANNVGGQERPEGEH
jgi:molecular chaperone GrpE